MFRVNKVAESGTIASGRFESPLHLFFSFKVAGGRCDGDTHHGTNGERGKFGETRGS